MANSQSYNTVTNALQQFANAHLSLKRFSVSFSEQFNNFSTSDNSFPILYAVPIDVNMQEYINTMTFRIYCVDILQKDRTNEATVLNDTLLVLRDLYNWITSADNEINLTNTPTAYPVNNFLVDFTVGWYMDVTIEITPESNDCSIPFSDNFTLTGITCDETYIREYLTCDTLADCASFINLSNLILTGGTYSNGTATFNNTNGVAFTITGFTSGVDTYVTGGTYNNSTGISTFTNNTGGTFNVTGYYTGSTDNDTYVTGGTYNNSTGTATFTNNTGGTFTVTNFYTGSTDNVY
jgi:hypothetical protein